MELLPKNTKYLAHGQQQTIKRNSKVLFEPYRSNEIRVRTLVGCVNGMDFKLIKKQQRRLIDGMGGGECF